MEGHIFLVIVLGLALGLLSIEGRGPKSCADLSTLPAACTQKSSKDVSSTLVSGTTGSFVGMSADSSSNFYLAQNAFGTYKSNTFANLNRGVVSKYSDKGVLGWEKMTCGSNTFFNNIIVGNSQVSVSGYIESPLLAADLCVINSVKVSNVSELDGRKVSFVASLDSAGTSRFVKSLDAFNGSTILSMTSDATDNIILAQKVIKYGQGLVSMDGIDLTLPNEGSNVVISEFSNSDGSLRWSSVLCEQPTSDEACQVLSIHSSYGVDDHILIVLSVKGSVTLKKNGRITSQGSKANIFIVGLSKTGLNVRFFKLLAYSTSTEVNNVKTTINQNGELILAVSCYDECFVNQFSVTPGAYLIQFNMFKITVDYAKLFVPLTTNDNIKISSIAIDAAGNPFTIVNSLSIPQVTIYDSDSRKNSFESPNILLIKHTPTGSVYWAQPIITSSTIGNVAIPSLYRASGDSTVSTFPTVPVVHQDNNLKQLNLNTFKQCLSTFEESGQSFIVGGGGGTSTIKTNGKVQSITFGGSYTVQGVTVTYFTGSGFSTGYGLSNNPKTITFDPEEIILEVDMSIDNGLVTVGYIYIRTDKQTFSYGTPKTLTKIVMDADKTVVSWTFKSGTYIDSIRVHTGDRENNYPLYCDCKSGLYGSTCAQTKCFGQDSNASGVCGGKGTCSSPNSCACNLGYSGHSCIDVNYCNNNSTLSDSQLCGTGSCKNDLCDCKQGYYGEKCQYWDCYGVNNMNASYVCSGNGQCQSPNSCVCNDASKYGGIQCELPICNSLLSNQTGICTGYGVCSAPEKCNCEPNYSGQYCEDYYCFGSYRNSSSVCSSRGKCIGIDRCSCPNGFYGNECELFNCYETLFNESSVCSSKGQCISPNNCTCQPGYYSNDCSLYQCYGVLMNQTSVCSGKGQCISPNNCSCPEGYSGQSCEKHNCSGIFKGDSNVCSGNGQCIALDTCQCKSTFNGTNCDRCIENYYGKLCTNSVPSKKATMTSTTSISVSFTSKKYFTTTTVDCAKVLSSASISKYGSISNCKPKVESSVPDSNGNYKYQLTFSYSSATFIPGDVFEFNVFCLETSESPVYVLMTYDDSSISYASPVVEVSIDTSNGDEAEVHKCFSTTFKVTRWTQPEVRASYRSLSWNIVGYNSSFNAQMQTAQNQLSLTIPPLSSTSTSLTIEILFESYFGFKKLFSFTFPINSNTILANGSSYRSVVRIRNNVNVFVKSSSFISDPCLSNSELAAPNRITLVSISDTLQISYVDQQFSLKQFLSNAPKTSQVKFYQTPTSFILINFVFTFEIATVTMNPRLFIDSTSGATTLSCSDADRYSLPATHIYEIQCYDCPIKSMVRSQVVEVLSTSSVSSLIYDLSIFGKLGSTNNFGLRCYRSGDALTTIPFTPFQVSLINSESFTELCKVLSFRFKNLVGNTIPYTSISTAYQLEVVMSSVNCPVKLTVTNSYSFKYTVFQGILPNRVNVITFDYIGLAIQQIATRVFTFSESGNVFVIDSTVSSSSLTMSAEKALVYPVGCYTNKPVYSVAEEVTIACTSYQTGVYAIYLDDFLLTASLTLPITATVPFEGTIYLASISSVGGIDKRKMATSVYSTLIFSPAVVSTVNNYVNGILGSGNIPLHYVSFFYYYAIKRPQLSNMDTTQVVTMYQKGLARATSLTPSTSTDSIILQLQNVAWLSNPYMMNLITFSSTVKFLNSFMTSSVSIGKKNPSVWTKQATKSLGTILSNLNVFSVQVAQMAFSAYSSPSRNALSSLAQIIGEVNQNDLFASITNDLSPIVNNKVVRQESLTYLSISDSRNNEWVRFNSKNIYAGDGFTSIQDVIVSHAIIKKPVPVSSSNSDPTSDYLAQFSMNGASNLLDKNSVFVSVPLSNKAAYNFYGNLIECSVVYETDLWSKDGSCTLINTYEAFVPEIGTEKIMMANCSCLLTPLMKTNSRAVGQTSNSNNAVGVYIYDNSAAVGLGIFFGLIVPMFYIIALVGTVVGVLLYWYLKVKPNMGKKTPDMKQIEMANSAPALNNPTVSV